MFWERSFISSPMAIDEAGNRAGVKTFHLLVDDSVAFDELEMKIYSKCMDINKETKEIFKDMADMINDVTDNYRSTLNELLESLV